MAISLFQLPNFVSGPMYNPMYVDLGLSKDVVGAVRGSFGLVGVFLGVAAGGYLSLRLGLMPAVLVGCVCQMLGTALYAVLPFAHDPVTFAVGHGAGQFRHRARRRHAGRLHVEPDQPGLHRDAICASVLDLCLGRQDS